MRIVAGGRDDNERTTTSADGVGGEDRGEDTGEDSGGGEG